MMTHRSASIWAKAQPGLRAVFREPMVLFAVVGVAIFAFSLLLDFRRERVISIGPADVAQLRLYWQTQTGRSPSDEELTQLVDERVREEVLYREALRIGLDDGDIIVRRRLAQKLLFIIEDDTARDVPSARELMAYFESNRERYVQPGSVSFEQIYFNPDRRGAALERNAQNALVQLVALDRQHQDVLGDPLMLPRTNVNVELSSLRSDYGEAFVSALGDLPAGVWAGPVRSLLGLHLVRITSRSADAKLPYEQVADRVLADFIQERSRAARIALVERLRRRYRVELPATHDDND